MDGFGTRELMIVAAAREIRDREVVFVGMRLPMMAYGLARRTHAPGAVGLFECGIVRAAPAEGLLHTMSDPVNQQGAAWSGGMNVLLGLLHGGRVDAGFIGGAEIDRFGNINTSYIGGHAHPRLKLPGSGGAADIAAMSRRLVAIMSHERRRLVPRVDHVTSVGGLAGGDSRARAGLGGGVAAVITDRAVLRPVDATRELSLVSWHPGESVASVRAATGWDLRVAADAAPTPPPSAAELAALRDLDREGFWRA